MTGLRYERQTIDLSADTGDGVATANAGHALYGELMEVQWRPTTGEGGSLEIIRVPGSVDDTGEGTLVLNIASALHTSGKWCPRQQGSNLTGGDSGDLQWPYIWTGENLVAKIRINDTGTDGPVAGTVRLRFRR